MISVFCLCGKCLRINKNASKKFHPEDKMCSVHTVNFFLSPKSQSGLIVLSVDILSVQSLTAD